MTCLHVECLKPTMLQWNRPLNLSTRGSGAAEHFAIFLQPKCAKREVRSGNCHLWKDAEEEDTK